MRSGRVFVALAALSLCTSPSTARVVQPTGKWVIDYATTQCTASREFGGPDSPVIFGIIPMPNEQGYELIIAAKGFGADPAVEMSGLFGFGGFAEEPTKIWVINFKAGTKLSGYRFHLTAQQIDKARSASSIWVRVPTNKFNVTIPLNSVGNVLQALHSCLVDLQQYWNSNGEKIGRIAVPPKGDLRSIFTGSDYPQEALERNQEGGAQYLLLVDETGKVAGCHLIQPSAIPAIDIMGCQVIKERAKFRPALDKQGKPTRSTVVTPPVVFRIAG